MSPRPPQGSHSTANQHAYIPQGAQQALSRQMQQSVPAHLKQYVNNSNGYVPPRVQQELTTYMEAALPQHLQQYAGAYVEQNVVGPSMMQRPGASQPSSMRPPKTINPRNLSHSGDVGSAQADANQMLGLFQPEHQRSQAAANQQPVPTLPGGSGNTPQAPQYPALQPPQMPASYDPNLTPPDSGQSEYDFIMNPPPAPKSSGFGNLSFGKRLGVVMGVGALLVIGFAVVSSLLKGGNGAEMALVTIAQDQTELLRVADQAGAHSTKASTNQLANATTLSITSDQIKLLGYLQQQKIKTGPKVLLLKHSAATDTAINTAVATSTFDQVFQEVLQNDLTSYNNDLRAAYSQIPGSRGQALLKSQYDNAGLLLEQAKQN